MMTIKFNGEWFSELLHKGRDRFHRYVFFSKAVIFIFGLILSNKLVDNAVVSILIGYLQYSWTDPNLPKAVVVVNMLSGLSSISEIIVPNINADLGYFKKIVISTALYVIGLVQLWFNDPFVSEKKGDRIFYMAAVFIALGKAGVDSLLKDFLYHQLAEQIKLQKMKEERIEEQPNIHEDPMKLNEEEELRVLFCTNIWWHFAKFSGSAIALFFLSKTSWEKTFKISALVMGASYLWFCSGFTFYSEPKPEPEPENGSSTSSIIFKQGKEVKQLLTILSIYISFLAYGLVAATGSTLFIEQSSYMNDRIGNNYKVEIIFFFVLKSFIRDAVLLILFWRKGAIAKKQSVNVVVIGAGMVCSVLCCIAAWQVEVHRLKFIKGGHFIVKEGIDPDNPDVIIRMSILWLAPQYSLLGLMEALTEGGLEKFFDNHLGGSLRRFGSEFIDSVHSIGTFVSVAFVFILRSWFKETIFTININTSHLDRYFLMLAILSSVSLCMVGCTYAYVEANRKTMMRGTHIDMTQNAPIAGEEQTNQEETDGNRVAGNKSLIRRSSSRRRSKQPINQA